MIPESHTAQPHSLDVVQVLKATSLLARATPAQVLALASIGRPVPFKAGVDPMAGLPTAVIVLMSGSLRVQEDGQASHVATAGDVIGVPTVLGGRPASLRVEALSDGAAVYFTRTEMFELLADHIDLLQAMYSALLKAPSHIAHA
jgi:CRP-like cAMP-binding protein